jgi:hypothetical protein
MKESSILADFEFKEESFIGQSAIVWIGGKADLLSIGLTIGGKSYLSLVHRPFELKEKTIFGTK